VKIFGTRGADIPHGIIADSISETSASWTMTETLLKRSFGLVVSHQTIALVSLPSQSAESDSYSGDRTVSN
jgi:hypothetical protein